MTEKHCFNCCPFRSDAGLVEHWDIPYGSLVDRDGLYYLIAFDNNIYVADSLFRSGRWPDPGTLGARNQWLALPDTPFVICVDSQGYVYAAFEG